MKDHSGNGTDHPRYPLIYGRVSKEDQGKSFSIPTQIEICQKLASDHAKAGQARRF